MTLSFFKNAGKKRDQIIAIDLGGRSTKAVHVQRQGEALALMRYCILDAPIYEKSLSVDLLTEHLKAVAQALEAKTKYVSLALSVTDAIVRQTELPQIPMDDMRQILKNNSKNYLQQDLPGHTFDCYFIPGKRSEAGEGKSLGAKLKVLVGGAKQQLVTDISTAVKHAGLIADQIVPGLVGPVNAFEMAMPDLFQKEAVALVDIGFKSSFICLLNRGELILSRVVNIGGDKLTQGLAEAMSVSYAEAEGIKVGMPGEVQAHLEPLLQSLGRELRASVNFFENQQDRTISHIYISGGTARSEFMVKALESELMVPCRSWNPAANLQIALPPAQAGEIEHIAPQLAVALGTALTAIN